MRRFSIACQSSGSGLNIHNYFALQRLSSRDRLPANGVSWVTSKCFVPLMLGRTESRSSFTGTRNRRQDSTTDRIVAIFEPDLALPTRSQLSRSRVTGRVEFFTILLDTST